MNQIDLKNKTAVITGGAQGFGYSMVERFSQSGAKIVIWDKDQELIDSLDQFLKYPKFDPHGDPIPN